MPKRKDNDDEKNRKKELIAEDWCFTCKDGGELLICDNRQCFKAYHPECVGKDDSVLKSNKRWICKWHSCLICDRASMFRCYCCPNAVCSRCIRDARFVRVKEKYGFCNDCLKLALLVEENMDIDSEGETVDLKDRETYEGLFKEYYEIIKEQEGFDADTVRTAKSQLDKDKSDQSSSDFNETDEGEDELLDSDENPYDSRGRERGQRRKKSKIQKAFFRKKETSKKMVFVSWGSEALIWFLKSVGEDTREELSLDDVERVILRYVKENKLFHPTKKRKIICDSKLQSFLRKKEVNKNSIPKLLECHFAKNQEESEDDEICDDIEDGDEKITVTCEVERKQKSDNNKQNSDKDILQKEGLAYIPQSCYAAIIPENIKLVYLKRSLVHELCKQPQAFENKVIGSFVRVKSNPSDIRYRNLYQLEQVTGIRSASVGEENSAVMLRVSNMPNDICLSMLSDGDFSEEECGELLHKVKAGLLKKPTLVEFQEKASSLHEDVTKHVGFQRLWIPRELAKLQNLINLANEKGWRRELYEYLNRKQKLQNPSEVSQLLRIFPVVIPDAGELEIQSEDINSERKENGTSQDLAPSIVAKEPPAFTASHASEEKGHSKTGRPLQSTANNELNRLKPHQQEELQRQSHNLPSVDQLEEALPGNEKPNQQTYVRLETENMEMATVIELVENEKSGVVTCNDKKEIQQTDVSLKNKKIHKQAMADVIKFCDDEKSGVVACSDKKLIQPMDAKLDKENSYKQTVAGVTEFDDDEKLLKVLTCGGKKQNQHTNVQLETGKSHKLAMADKIEYNDNDKAEVATEDPGAIVWHITGMNEKNEKYSLSFLKSWSESYAQAFKFKVWKEGQCEDTAIPLGDAVKLAFPRNTR